MDASIQHAGRDTAAGPSTQQTARLILYVDRDGLNDFIVGSRKKGPSMLRIVDIDSDGDLDIVSIGWGHGRVVLYENLAVD